MKEKFTGKHVNLFLDKLSVCRLTQVSVKEQDVFVKHNAPAKGLFLNIFGVTRK